MVKIPVRKLKVTIITAIFLSAAAFVYGAAVSLPEAVDDLSLSMYTQGYADWFGQSVTFTTGGDAAQSGLITDGQDTVLGASVTGASGVRFDWKASSEEDYDYLEFYIDYVRVARISGDTGWWTEYFPLDPGSHDLEWGYVKDGSVSDRADCGWVDNVVVNYAPPISLPEALDDLSLTVDTTGNVGWFGQPITYTTGNDAAESGHITDGQYSQMDTSVSGVSSVGFDWKVSSEENYDSLTFYIDGVAQAAISGETGWAHVVYLLSAGPHDLWWEYDKDESVSEGLDCGWVDNITFNPAPTATPTPAYVPLPEAVDNLSLSFALSGNSDWFGQTTTSMTGGDAAQSGKINSDETTTMATTISGYGGVSFYWKVSSLPVWNTLRFYIDGGAADEISGANEDWALKSYDFDTGTHTLSWTYAKIYSNSYGSDCGWVDDIVFRGTATQNPTDLVVPPTETATPTMTVTPAVFITPGSGSQWELSCYSTGFAGRRLHTSLVFGGKMWVIGGQGGFEDFSYVWSFEDFNDVLNSMDGITWTQPVLHAGFEPRSGHSSVVFNGKMWVIGGYDDTNKKMFGDVWSSSDGVNWDLETASPAFGPRCGQTSVVFNNRIWVIGGANDAVVAKNDVWSSADGINWVQETASAGFAPRAFHSSVVHDGRIWVIDGYNEIVDFFNDVWYSFDGKNWVKAVDEAPFAKRYGSSALSFGGKIWVIGGNAVFPVNDVWSSPDGVAWSMDTGNSEFTGRVFHSSVVFNNKMWVINGELESGLVADVWHSPPGQPTTPTPAYTATLTPVSTPTMPAICPGIFGKPTPMGTAVNISGYYWANKYNVPQDGVVKAINIYIANPAGGNIRTAIYSDDGSGYGQPVNLLVESDQSYPSVPGWFRIIVPDTYIPAGYCWLAFQVFGKVDIDVQELDLINHGAYAARGYGPFESQWPKDYKGLDPFSWTLYAEYCEGTPTPVYSPTITLTQTATQYVLPTITQTASQTVTMVYTMSRTSTDTMTPSLTMTPATPTITPTAVMTETAFKIGNPLVYPNPADPLTGGNFYVEYYLSQNVDEMKMEIFTNSFRLVKKIQLCGNDSAGAKVKIIPTSVLGGFGNGVYYYLIEGTSAGGVRARAKAKVLLILK
jgi:hypothetical protein